MVLGDRTIADTTRAVLVWEPRRIVPSYAVPVQEVEAELLPFDDGGAGHGGGNPGDVPNDPY